MHDTHMSGFNMCMFERAVLTNNYSNLAYTLFLLFFR